MKFPRPRQEQAEVNLTPLIDVVFLLLIFFMVSTTFTRETQLALTLPEAQGTPPEGPEDGGWRGGAPGRGRPGRRRGAGGAGHDEGRGGGED